VVRVDDFALGRRGHCPEVTADLLAAADEFGA
jgi:hypothetical protein